MLSLFSESVAVEPLTLNECKLQLKLPVSTVHPEDDLIEDILIPAVRERCEKATNRQLREVTYDWSVCEFPDAFEVPKPPLLSVVSITYVDTSGVTQTLATNQYTVYAPTGEFPSRGRITPAYSVVWPSTRDQENAVTVRFRCGYGATTPIAGPAVPALLKAGMLLDCATLYRDRENLIKGTIVQELPGGRRGIYWTCRSHATQAVAA